MRLIAFAPTVALILALSSCSDPAPEYVPQGAAAEHETPEQTYERQYADCEKLDRAEHRIKCKDSALWLLNRNR